MTLVTTVRGPIQAADLGICLTHEHVLNDVKSWWHLTESIGLDPEAFAHKPLGIEDLWDLKHDPFANLDNCRLDDVELAVVRSFDSPHSAAAPSSKRQSPVSGVTCAA